MAKQQEAHRAQLGPAESDPQEKNARQEKEKKGKKENQNRCMWGMVASTINHLFVDRKICDITMNDFN